MKRDGASRPIAADYQRARVVTEHAQRHAPKMGEGGGNTLAPIVLTFAQEGFHKDPT